MTRHLATWTGRIALLLVVGAAASGCGARSAFRKGRSEARQGHWDLAVAKLTQALDADPGNVEYHVALQTARLEASRAHQQAAERHLQAGDLEKAADEMDIAGKYDPSNRLAVDGLKAVRARIEARDAEKVRLASFDEMKRRAAAAPAPVPVLSPRSPVPIVMNFPEQSVQKVFEALGKLAGVNILFDDGFRDARKAVSMSGISFQQALDQLCFANRLFYKVLDQNTIILVPDTAAKRRTYEEVLLRTFYIQNGDAKEIEAVVKTSVGTTIKTALNPSLGAITVTGTPDELALTSRVIELNDKPRGEVMVEVQVLEVNREQARRFGLDLSSHQVGVAFSPNGEAAGVQTTLRAHLLASLNLADFVVSLPQSLFTELVRTEGVGRILAAPRLRAAEGKKTEMKIGQEVPIPVTSFQATTTGAGTFTPAVSFQYRNVGVNLELTPKVSAAGEIALELAAEFSLEGSPRGFGDNQTLPTFSTRSIKGILRVEDGQTSLIGGLLQESETDQISTILGLNRLPLLNKVLGARQPRKVHTEVLIAITPHLMRAPRVFPEDLAPLSIGTREIIKVPGARPPLFGPEEPAPEPSPATDAAPAASPAPPPPPVPAPIPSPPPPDNPPAAPPLGAGAATLSPGAAVIKVGQTTTFSLLASSVTVGELEMELAFDGEVVEVTDVTPGPLLTLDGTQVAADKELQPGEAHILFSRATAASGSGILATVTVRGKQPGQATLSAPSLAVRDQDEEQTLTASPVRITVTP